MKKIFGFIAIGITAFGLTVTACNRLGEEDTTTTTVAAPTLTVSSPEDYSTNASGVILVAGTAATAAGWGTAGGVTLFVGTTAYGVIGQDTFSTNVILANGDYVFKLQAWDKNLNFSEEVVRHVHVDTNIVDTTPPQVVVTVPSSGQYISNAFTASGTASDDIGLQAVYAAVDSGTFAQASGLAGWTFSTNVSAGSHTFKVFAVDTAGNHSATNSVNFTFVNSDMTAPAVSISVPGSGQVVTNVLNASGTASDNVIVTAVYAAFDSGTFKQASGTASWTLTTNLGAGAHTMKAFAVDGVGNSSTTNSVSFTVYIDTTPPTVSISVPGSGQVVTNVLNASGTASDNIAVTAVYAAFDSGTFKQASGTASWTLATNLGAGAHTIHVFAVDAKNNHSATNSVAFDFVIDGTFEFWTAGVPDGWNNGVAYNYGIPFDTISMETTEIHDGLRAVKLTWDGDPVSNCTFWTEMSNINPGDRLYFSIWAKSGASDNSSIGITWYNASHGYLSATYLKSYSASPTTWTNYSAVAIAPANAVYAVPTIYGSKTVGSDTRYLDDYEFDFVSNVDATPPQIDSLATPADSSTWGNLTIPYVGTASDNLMLYRIGACVSNLTNYTTASPENFNGSIDVSSLSAGSYVMSVWAEDYAGLISSAVTRNITLTNAVAPAPFWAYANSDMEADMHTNTLTMQLTPAYSTATNHSGTRSYHISGTAGGNGWLFQSNVKLNDALTNSKLVFYIYGTSLLKSIGVTIGNYNSATGGDYFNLATISGSDVVLSRSGSVSYTGTIDTGGGWIKVTCNLAGLSTYNTNTITNAYFGMRCGGTGVYDIYLDDIHFEQ